MAVRVERRAGPAIETPAPPMIRIVPPPRASRRPSRIDRSSDRDLTAVGSEQDVVGADGLACAERDVLRAQAEPPRTVEPSRLQLPVQRREGGGGSPARGIDREACGAHGVAGRERVLGEHRQAGGGRVATLQQQVDDRGVDLPATGLLPHISHIFDIFRCSVLE